MAFTVLQKFAIVVYCFCDCPSVTYEFQNINVPMPVNCAAVGCKNTTYNFCISLWDTQGCSCGVTSSSSLQCWGNKPEHLNSYTSHLFSSRTKDSLSALEGIWLMLIRLINEWWEITRCTNIFFWGLGAIYTSTPCHLGAWLCSIGMRP